MTAPEVPDRFDIALDGHTYMLDTNHAAFGTSGSMYSSGIQTLPLLRSQADASSEPGGAARNREDLWPRGQQSWHRGAGQEFLDRDGSDRARFRASRGMDVWTENRLGRLDATANVYSSTATLYEMESVGSVTFVLEVSSGLLKQTSFSGSPTAVTLPIAPAIPFALASDGSTVYVGFDNHGIEAISGAATVAYSALEATTLDYVKGRLMAAKDNAIYNVTASGAAPTALFTHPNTFFTWVGFAEGQNNIYAAGYASDRSFIYKTAVKADGTSLDVPTVAGQLPRGEVVKSIYGYLGYIVIGTDQGFRFATSDGDGNLTIGALVDIDAQVHGFAGKGRFIFFGWSSLDSTHTGVGRMDITQQSAPNVPAYASDLMAEGFNSTVRAVTNQNGTIYFAVSGHGVYGPTGSPVATATLDSGHLEYGMPEQKFALRANVKHDALSTGNYIKVYVASDEGSPALVGTIAPDANTYHSFPFSKPAFSHEVRVELGHTSLGGFHQLDRYELMAYPSATRAQEFNVPILLRDHVLTANGDEVHIDVGAEYAHILSLIGTNALVEFIDLGTTYSVIVDQAQLERWRRSETKKAWQGTLVCKLKSFALSNTVTIT